MARRLGRRDKTPQTTIRVSTETRDRLMVLLDLRTAKYYAERKKRDPWARGGRQYGETAPVTMDDVVRELLRTLDNTK